MLSLVTRKPVNTLEANENTRGGWTMSLDKGALFLKTSFLISHPKLMMKVLKRTVKTDGLENIPNFSNSQVQAISC